MYHSSYYISAPKNGRRFVISDIHGCNQTFQKLIWDKIRLTKKDQLFLLGDYVDKGPDTKGLLDTIIYLQEVGYSIFPLLGNHEKELLDYEKEEFRFLKWHLTKNNELNLLNKKKTKLKKKYHRFFKKLPYYYILNDYYLVHAGFNTNNGKTFTDKTAMLELRKMKYSDKIFQGKTIVTGHHCRSLNEIKKQIVGKKKIINLDNGAVYKGKRKKYMCAEDMGNLCALNLDTKDLIVCQTNDF